MENVGTALFTTVLIRSNKYSARRAALTGRIDSECLVSNVSALPAVPAAGLACRDNRPSGRKTLFAIALHGVGSDGNDVNRRLKLES